MRSPFLTSSFKGFERLSNKLSEFAEVQSSDTSGVHNQDLGTINHPLEWLLRLLNPCMCVSTCSVFAHCSPSPLMLASFLFISFMFAQHFIPFQIAESTNSLMVFAFSCNFQVLGFSVLLPSFQTPFSLLSETQTQILPQIYIAASPSLGKPCSALCKRVS